MCDFSVLHEYWHQSYTNIIIEFIDKPTIHEIDTDFLKNLSKL